MEMEIMQEKQNDLLARKEVIVKIVVEGATPPRKEVLKALQQKFTAAEESIVIDKIEHPFGTKFARVYAKIYSDAEGAKREPAYKKARDEGKKKEAKPAA